MSDIFNPPLISVIIPLYNAEKYVAGCLESITNQTYKNLEIIIADDGSEDGGTEVCKKYAEKDGRISIFSNSYGGVSSSRNFGLSHAKGEYVVFIDADDYADKDYVEYLYRLIKKYNTKMSICQHRFASEKKIIKDYGNNGDCRLSSKECISRMMYHDVIDTSVWGKMYRRELFESIKYPEGYIYEDIAVTWKLFEAAGKIAVGFESKYNYIYRSSSIVNSGFSPRKLDLLKMTDRMAKGVVKKYPDLKQAVLRRRVYARFSTLNQMLYTREYQAEKKIIIDFIKGNSKRILMDKKAPARDKAAVVLLNTDYRLYAACWKLYLKIRKGI